MEWQLMIFPSQKMQRVCSILYFLCDNLCIDSPVPADKYQSSYFKGYLTHLNQIYQLTPQM